MSGNSAASGGGIDMYDGTLTIENSTISNNHSRVGGGIETGVGATLTITNSTLSGNSAEIDGRGGGIFSFGGPATITNSTLSGNNALQGGGIYNYAPLTLTNVTLSGNSATQGGGALYVVNNSRATATLVNTLLANSLAGGNCVDQIRLITDSGYNLADDGTCNLTASTSLPNTNPQLGPLANNGGLTQTHALLVGSPAIDRIPLGTNGCGTTVTTDQRGVARPQGSGCDIGAYEVAVVTDHQPPLVSNVTANPTSAPANTNVTLTATIDDSTTGGSNIASADYNVDGGTWSPMNAADGTFNSPTEQVTATLTFTQYGVHTVCIRGTDVFSNTSAQECTIVTVESIPGDLNGDGRVDCNDLGIVKASFGKRSGQTGFDPRADVNSDGVVDVRDLAIVAHNLPAGTKCL